MFQKAKWIWCREADESDTYCEFTVFRTFEQTSGVVLRIAADSDYAVYINGEYAASGQYLDYPQNKAYDEFDISEYLKEGTNTFGFTVWYIGESNFMYCRGKAGLIFEVEANGEILLASDQNTRCRKSKRYLSGRRQIVTPQLGYGFEINMRNALVWEEDFCADLSGSIECDMPLPVHKRENKKLVLEDRIVPEIIQQGTFIYNETDRTDGAKMQRAFLSFSPLSEIGKKEGNVWCFSKPTDQIYLIFDLQKEAAGFLDFDIETQEECTAIIGWGEHLCDGRCRTEIDYRDFSSVIHFKKGRNRFLQPLRRFGCRYLQLFLHSSAIKIHYFGIRPTEYPLTKVPFSTGSLLRDTIYDVCVDTLKLCMHEHYEDCPWREQSLYTLDSRNQMLCGYYAFREYEFPRSSLRLIAAGIREDGLLPITAPTDCNLTIPFFSLIYPVQVLEHYQHSGDQDTVDYCFPFMEKIIKTFLSRIDKTGLLPNFKGKDYWNFYEWQPFLDGETYKDVKYDLCINAALSYALEAFIRICRLLGKPTLEYNACRTALNQTIKNRFFDPERRLFCLCLSHDEEKISVLGNALCVLCGAADGLDTAAMEELLAKNGQGAVTGIPSTLSMFLYRYDALLKINRDKYRNLILEDIDKEYLYMLRNGATSFWETIKGQADFNNAGSLCHGWSALPIYYFWKLCGEKNR